MCIKAKIICLCEICQAHVLCRLNQTEVFYKSLRLLLHSLFYPIYHKANKGVFIKVDYKLLVFLSYWNVNRLLLDYTEQEVICQSV